MPRWVRDGVWALRAGGRCEPIGDSVARRAGRMGWGVRGRFMAAVVVVGVVVQPSLPTVVGAPGVEPAPLMAHLSDELSYAMKHLVASDGTRPYFINYTVYDEARAIIAASLGAIISNNADRDRKLNIDLRVGDYKLDNTHQLRGGGPSKARGNGNIELPLGDNEYAVHNALWFHTDRIFKRACKRLRQIKTNVKVKVEEDDASNDFSHERAHVYHEAPAEMVFDRDAWADRLRKISAVAREHPLIYDSRVTFGSLARTRYMVTSEGTRLQTAHRRFRITLSAATKAEDGMDLSQSVDFNAATVDGLPADAEKCYRQGLELNPDDRQTRSALAEALGRQQKWDEAEACYRQLAIGEPDDPDLQVRLGFVLVRQDRLDEAVELFQKVLTAKPDYHEIHNNLGYIYERQGRLDDDLAAARRALEICPDYAEGHNNLGTALKSLGRLDEACSSFQQALALQPDFALAEFNWGTTLLLQ
ncbi:MAG: tetratricopeptide repeat protein [Planctomycetes bacterium]|nr:tetratricopeptide repeat protein [Planctomycetota bacterium]